MAQIETLARQAWQLRQQGYAIDGIAEVMGQPASAIERWVGKWPEIAQHMPPWHQGLKPTTVQCLRKAGITSRAALIESWEAGSIKRGQPPGIGVSRWVELWHWLAEKGTEVPLVQPRAMVIDLTPEAEAALNHLRRASGQTVSQLVSRLLVEADEPGRNG